MKQSDIISKYPEIGNDFWTALLLYSPTVLGESYRNLQDRVIPEIKLFL
ncbi:histidine phosphatase family protein [Clostridium botulinum]|nr:histidine phosphatase family protein [Clostridium botulinum]NFO05222.1 histidine phosphatase family protein [Clostridium botulinum]NFR14509.1 histidine phosphatase family protein [Clostridium botulinum]NFR44680.1 histidine phosphatase family protein [Clostridium botulinum]NFS51866.1 histidine phosphatase family protein [Clostridium botulinum]